MINSNNRKLALSGWLKENNPREYSTPIKLQKFLLFYELFSKIDGENSDFSHLRGYKRGPVFSDVWGDYTKERYYFDIKATEQYKDNIEKINNDRAKLCAFVVQVLSDTELSDFTHNMNLWKSKQEKIAQGEKQVSLNIEDFNSNDEKMIKLLKDMYPVSLIDNSVVVELNNFSFVFNKEDYKKFTPEHLDSLYAVTQIDKDLHNPVYVEIDEQGGLLID